MLGKGFCSDGVKSGIEEDCIEARVKKYKCDSGAGSIGIQAAAIEFREGHQEGEHDR
jgi:hypothetical protein